MKKKSSYRGLQTDIRDLKTPTLDTWENMYPDKKYTVTIEIPEFTCICPKTGLPDFATIKIQYIPDKYCLELKSLKYYINFYRNIGIFHEHVINKIMEDFIKACKPRWVRIEGEFNPRGGIKTMVMREYKAKKR
ncbi:MAG: preQ(1) synthase [Candidatus Omnitrophica bacterium]|nr:preQ(1) synthase [Candidatus Omnitrophota bacterium]